jgi:MFS transporter, DHA1 family, tetracycline resistance protein
LLVSSSRKAGLLLVFVTVFIDLLGFGIVLPLLPHYGEAFQADGWQIGLLMASFSAMQFLFAPIWGRLSDRVGRRPILILGLAGSTVSYALFGYATSLGVEGRLLGLTALTWLFITRIGAGIAGATIPTAQAYIADITGPRERAKGMALIGAAFGIGFTFGPLLGAFFVSDVHGSTPTPAPGYVAAVISGCALLFAIIKLPESLNPDSKPVDRHWFDIQGFRAAIRHPHVGMVLVAMFLTTFAFGQFEATLSLLTERIGLSQRHNFYVFAYIGLILTLSQGILVRRLVPKLGDFRMGLTGVLLMVAGMLAIAQAASEGTIGQLYAVFRIRTGGNPRPRAEHVRDGPDRRPGRRVGSVRPGRQPRTPLLVRRGGDAGRSVRRLAAPHRGVQAKAPDRRGTEHLSFLSRWNGGRRVAYEFSGRASPVIRLQIAISDFSLPDQTCANQAPSIPVTAMQPNAARLCVSPTANRIATNGIMIMPPKNAVAA